MRRCLIVCGPPPVVATYRLWGIAMETGEWVNHRCERLLWADSARFTHFLDSGEQGLQVIVLFNDIKPRAGGTYISPDGIKNVVQ